MRRILFALVLLLPLCLSAQTLTPVTTINPPASTTGFTAEQGAWSVSSSTFVNTSAPGLTNPFTYTSWSSGNDQAACFTEAGLAAAASKPGVGVRNGGNNSSGYSFYFSSHSGTTITGITPTIGQSDQSAVTGLSIPQTQKVCIGAIGSYVFIVSGGSTIWSKTDTTYTSGSPFLKAWNTFTSANGLNYVEFDTAAWPAWATDNFGSYTTGSAPGGGWTNTANCQVVAGGDQTSGKALSTNASQCRSYYTYVAAASGSQTAQAQVHWTSASTTSSDVAGVCVNAAAPGGNLSAYCFDEEYYATAAHHTYVLSKWVSNSKTVLAYATGENLPPNDATISLVSSGTSTVTLTPTLNGSPVSGMSSSYTDSSSPLTGNYPGVITTTASTTQTYLFNFGGGVPPAASNRAFVEVF